MTTLGPRTMSTEQFMSVYTNADRTGWSEERAWLERYHPNRTDRIQREITTDGFFPPVQVDDTDHTVVDGHHRVVAAWRAGVALIPYDDAWREGNDWVHFADDSPADDPPHTEQPDHKETT